MAASVTIRVRYGASPGTLAAAISGIDLCSADSALNSSANRKAYPIAVGGKSYEKWLQARVDSAPSNYVKDFVIWGDGAVQANTDLFFGVTDTYVTPVATDSAVATTDFTTAVVGSKASWDTSELTDVGHVTDYLVMQLDVGAGAALGNWTQETINYQYTEA